MLLLTQQALGYCPSFFSLCFTVVFLALDHSNVEEITRLTKGIRGIVDPFNSLHSLMSSLYCTIDFCHPKIWKGRKPLLRNESPIASLPKAKSNLSCYLTCNETKALLSTHYFANGFSGDCWEITSLNATKRTLDN